MAPVVNTRLIFNKIPKEYPIPGETTVLDKSENIDLDAPLQRGSALIRVLYLSIDPYMRGCMRDEKEKLYSVTGIPLGGTHFNYGVGVVVRSENPKFKAGEHLYGVFKFQEYVIESDFSQLNALPTTPKVPWAAYIGVLGMPGQTAYVGWKLYSEAKKGETVFISSAAGAVGSVVIPLAKSQGLKVVASAGSDEKVKFLKDIGADVVFNYKTKPTAEALKELGHGIDICWEHVGGEVLEAAIDAANDFARIIVCGAISAYNTPIEKCYGIKDLYYILTKRLTIHGFIVSDHWPQMLPEFYDEFPNMVANGQIEHREQRYQGLESAEKAIDDVQRGRNHAKVIIEVGKE